MRHHLFTRIAVCAAMAGSATLAAAVIPGSIASASPLKVTCTSTTGSATSVTVSGCTGTGAVTADAGSPPAHGVLTVSNKTLKWSNGKTSVLAYKYVLHTGSANLCSAKTGYSKTDMVTESGTVSGGTALGLKGGTLGGTVCVYTLIAAPHTISVVNRGNSTI
jgi:hypothetical protein